ncbi:MAG: glycerate kinase, partial [Oscillibacter sp.]
MPDSFKGTLDSQTVCALMEQAILKRLPDAQVLSIPVADGGEGTVDCFVHALGAEKIVCPAQSPLGEPIESFYGFLPNGTAIVEMAAAAGLPLVEGRENALAASTYGVGLLIRAAVARGAQNIILGLGGSATTDGGVGAASALGVRFLDRVGRCFLPVGGTLEQIAAIDPSAV